MPTSGVFWEDQMRSYVNYISEKPYIILTEYGKKDYVYMWSTRRVQLKTINIIIIK